MDSWYRNRRMELTRTHVIDMNSWYKHELKVLTWTHVIDMTDGIDPDSWYSIGTYESHMSERAECCPYAGFSYLYISINLEI